ncbi:type 1 glutamine amidotransferase domain-containing protein, partial [Mesorhizobium sp. M4A.F.Ca.ET.029.04.2.1]
RLVTGQNPGSSVEAAEALMAAVSLVKTRAA